MKLFKTKKSCLVLFLLIFHCSSLYPGEVLSLDGSMEGFTIQQEQIDPSQNGENMPLLASPPFPVSTNKNFPFVPSLDNHFVPYLNNQGQQPQPLYQQLNYPEQSLNQPFSGFTQPFSSINQPSLGANQPFGVSNQQALADNTAFDNGASKENRFIIGVALVPLITLIATL